MGTRFARFLLILGLSALSTPANATDVDGPDGDNDFGDMDDAPHGIPAYPDGTIGKFPHVYHINNYDAWNLWLGGYPTNWQPGQGPVYGVDGDDSALPPNDCTENAFGMTFAQDECIQDSTDMCLRSPVLLNPCEMTTFRISYIVQVAGGGGTALLNVLVDFNGDGDFDDVVYCPASQDSVPEWVAKNVGVPWGWPNHLEMNIPSFRVGPRSGPAWMRITLTTADTTPTDDFPVSGGELLGGETEDYPIMIGGNTPVHSTTWGLLKSRYQ
jgi:GEVED domain-containing protein